MQTTIFARNSSSTHIHPKSPSWSVNDYTKYYTEYYIDPNRKVLTIELLDKLYDINLVLQCVQFEIWIKFKILEYTSLYISCVSDKIRKHKLMSIILH